MLTDCVFGRGVFRTRYKNSRAVPRRKIWSCRMQKVHSTSFCAYQLAFKFRDIYWTDGRHYSRWTPLSVMTPRRAVFGLDSILGIDEAITPCSLPLPREQLLPTTLTEATVDILNAMARWSTIIFSNFSYSKNLII